MDHISINEDYKAVIFLAENDEVTNNVIKSVSKILGEENFLILVVDENRGEEEPRGVAGAASSGPVRKKYKSHIKDDEHSKESEMSTIKNTNAFLNWSKTLPLRLKYQQLVGLCKMPVFIHQSVSYLCYAGLCTVIRMMVKHVQKSNPQTKAISLLVGI